jgi:hypothetical protein
MTPIKRRRTNPRLRKDLIIGLEHLRSEAKEISRLYVANLQRDLVQLIDFINMAGTTRPNSQRGLTSTFTSMKQTLDKITVKPEKGRRKDLRRIEQAVRSMMKLALNNKTNA